jgi:tetratricopeptide (TPR) repeat protein
MKRFSVLLTAVGVMLVTAMISAQAPGGGAPQGRGGGAAPQLPEPKNLKFFPKEMTAQQIIPIMANFNAALGVNCGYCHVFDGPPATITCHRGVAIPKQLVAVMMETASKEGVAKALQQYQDLRKQYYGTQAYDFSDTTLFTAAQQSLAAMKPDDAIAFAQLNLAFNANSARSYQVLSQAYQRKGDKTPAIQSLERAVELDPMNQGFKNQLQQLKSGA